MSVQPRLTIVPSELDEANAFVAQVHRHHEPVIGHKFSLAVADEDWQVRGVAIVDRPTARMRQDGWTLEVTRVATDGCENACSCLYAACWRAAKAMGYRRLGTYTLKMADELMVLRIVARLMGWNFDLAGESGASLRAAGWHIVHEVRGRSWDCPSRPRVDKHPLQGKLLWEAS